MGNIINDIVEEINIKPNKLKLVICEDRVPRRKRELVLNNKDAFVEYPSDTNYKYKGKRPKKNYLYNPIEICRQFIDCIPHTKIWAENEEADDVIAAYVKSNYGEKVYIYSTDRDLWQLLGKNKNIKIFLDDGSEPNEEKLEKRFCEGTTFDKVILHKVIKGDSGDNVKSVLRFPFKKHIESYQRCNGTIEHYIKCVSEDYGDDSEVFKRLINNALLIRLNYWLVKLKDDIKYDEQIITNYNYNTWLKLCNVFQIPSMINFLHKCIFY